MTPQNVPITPLESQWDSAIVRQLLYAALALFGTVLANIFGLSTESFLAKGGQIIDALITFAVIAWPLWLAYRARRNRPTPPIEGTPAVEATAVREQALGTAGPTTLAAVSQPGGKQKGYIRAGLLGLILAISGAGTAALTMSGCASLGLPVAEGFNEKAASGIATVTSIRETALALGQAGVMTPEDVRGIQDQATEARKAIDIARGLQGLNFKAAEQRLDSTIAVLKALDKYLKQRGG